MTAAKERPLAKSGAGDVRDRCGDGVTDGVKVVTAISVRHVTIEKRHIGLVGLVRLQRIRRGIPESCLRADYMIRIGK